MPYIIYLEDEELDEAVNEWDALADGSTLLSLGLKIENNFESLSGKLFY